MSDILAVNILFMTNDFTNKCRLIHCMLFFYIPLNKKLTYNTNNNIIIPYCIQTKVFFTSYSDSVNFMFICMKITLLTVVELRI